MGSFAKRQVPGKLSVLGQPRGRGWCFSSINAYVGRGDGQREREMVNRTAMREL